MDNLYAGVCAVIRSLVWSNTAMTMPSRIRVWKTSDNIGSTHGWNESYGETQYIRADIAEELARALREIAGMDAIGSSAVAYNALRQYRAITP